MIPTRGNRYIFSKRTSKWKFNIDPKKYHGCSLTKFTKALIDRWSSYFIGTIALSSQKFWSCKLFKGFQKVVSLFMGCGIFLFCSFPYPKWFGHVGSINLNKGDQKIKTSSLKTCRGIKTTSHSPEEQQLTFFLLPSFFIVRNIKQIKDLLPGLYIHIKP